MDFEIIKIANNLLKKRGMRQEYAVLVETENASISPAIKIYHVTLYKLTFGEVPSKFIVDKFTEGGVFKDKETAYNVINERIVEYFLENGI